MKLILIILTIGCVSAIEAMSIKSQELVSVGIYKKAYKVGLITSKGIRYARRKSRYCISNHSGFNLNNFSDENSIRIDLHHLFSKALIESWKKSCVNQYCNEYMNFLLENKIPSSVVSVLYQILNKYKSNGAKSENQDFVVRGVYPILNRFTSDADYYRDITYITTYIKDPKDVVMFYEIIGKNLMSLGLDKTFFNSTRERFARIDRINDIDLDRKKDSLINEYQNRSIRESWLKNLYVDAVRYGVISQEEWNQILNAQEKVGINPVKIVMNAAIKMVMFNFRVCDFLSKYGMRHSSIFKIIPIIKSFLDPNIKMICYVDGLQRILRTISDDLAIIGISDGSYYISKEAIISDLQKG